MSLVGSSVTGCRAGTLICSWMSPGPRSSPNISSRCSKGLMPRTRATLGSRPIQLAQERRFGLLFREIPDDIDLLEAIRIRMRTGLRFELEHLGRQVTRQCFNGWIVEQQRGAQW